MILVFGLVSLLAVLLAFGIAWTLSLPWWLGVLVGITLYSAGVVTALYIIRRFKNAQEFNFDDYDY